MTASAETLHKMSDVELLTAYVEWSVGRRSEE